MSDRSSLEKVLATLQEARAEATREAPAFLAPGLHPADESKRLRDAS